MTNSKGNRRKIFIRGGTIGILSLAVVAFVLHSRRDLARDRDTPGTDAVRTPTAAGARATAAGVADAMAAAPETIARVMARMPHAIRSERAELEAASVAFDRENQAVIEATERVSARLREGADPSSPETQRLMRELEKRLLRLKNRSVAVSALSARLNQDLMAQLPR